ncbi:MAG TPA: hypothetical protein VK884_07850 [Verrucomicrobiae bacterium]|jgi:hypothetical protein|nr:hypothetical protein [Verrucomicrobiae bacterium]
MIPTIEIEVDEGRFSVVARVGAAVEVGDGVRIAQRFWLEEMIGVIFGAITLWYLVSSMAGLA